MQTPIRSAAIQIVRPPDVPKGIDTPEKAKKADATQRLCRNVLIYGSCRFQDQGCAYFHPVAGSDPAAVPSVSPTTPTLETPTPTPKTTLNAAAAPYPTPESKEIRSSTGLGFEHLAAPVFVPKTPLAGLSPPSASPDIQPAAKVESEPKDATKAIPSVDWASAQAFSPPEFIPTQQQQNHVQSGGLVQSQMGYDEGLNYEASQTLDGMMFVPPTHRRVLDHHLYTAPLPYVAAGHQPMHSFFIPDDLRRMVQSRQEAVYANPGLVTGLPAEVHVYHSLIPIGNPVSTPSKTYHLPAPLYRATSSVDGNVYCLRRIEGFKLVNEHSFGAIDKWCKMRHANIVGLREAFTTKAFGDDSLIMVYDFMPDSTTVADEWLGVESIAHRRQTGIPIPERIIWSYVIQIANALKAIHTAGLAVRNLDASKILITGKNRVRINCVGIFDVLAFDNATPAARYQQDDLISFGQLILSLCCDFMQPGQHYAIGIEYIGRAYSLDLKTLVGYLLGKPSALKKIDEVVLLAGPRILNELDAQQNYTDVLETELGSEIENGRIVRLLTKLGFINERREFDMDPRWSETGDRYVLKLFRDYVFHSAAADGRPVLDLSHVLTCLNKLDAGARSREKIMLVSRDTQSCLIVEYREIYKCIESAYGELKSFVPKPPALPFGR